MRHRFCLLPLVLTLWITRPAGAYPIEKGSNELRPLIGIIAAMDPAVQPSQFQLGLEWTRSLDGPLGFVLGLWSGFADGYVGLEVHAGAKYRFLRLHPKFAPFVLGGFGVSAGFNTSGGQALTGAGVRVGSGVDFFVNRRVMPGIQIVFDMGPRFTPDVRFLGSVQITAGVGFLL
jgi:hypothetical protein